VLMFSPFTFSRGSDAVEQVRLCSPGACIH
jgi:hypothetical protein